MDYYQRKMTTFQTDNATKFSNQGFIATAKPAIVSYLDFNFLLFIATMIEIRKSVLNDKLLGHLLTFAY